MKDCEEHVEVMNGEPVIVDSHKWVEIIDNKKLQILKCSICGKHSTATKPKNYDKNNA